MLAKDHITNYINIQFLVIFEFYKTRDRVVNKRETEKIMSNQSNTIGRAYEYKCIDTLYNEIDFVKSGYNWVPVDF